jgi:putative ABC transport system permease protein
MLKSYLLSAFRNLRKNKSSAIINIGGLSIGMAVAILIGLWIWDEVSFDKYNKNYDHIAMVMQHMNNNGEVFTRDGVPFLLADELRSNYGSDFNYMVMCFGFWQKHILTSGEKKFSNQGGYFESKAPDLLDLNMLYGSRDALRDPDAILLSESVARAYFGDADPVNKILTIDNKQQVKVTGVYKDIPKNSMFASCGFIAAWQQLYNSWGLKDRPHPWRMNAFQLFVRLADNADINQVSVRIRDAKLKKIEPKEAASVKPRLFLYPMTRWHLFTEWKNGINSGGAVTYVWLFGTIGIFVLLLACINFMNLSTARSEKRAREVGIRKAIGSMRRQLIEQFFVESLMIVAFAFAIALALAQLSMPFFNEIADKKMILPWYNPFFWLFGIGFCLLTALIAGSYPALYLSSFKPVKVLKGSFRVGRFAAIPRKVLIVLQFTVSVILIIGTVIVFRQIKYAEARPMGYDRNGLVMIPMKTSAIHDHFDVVKTELLNAGVVKAMSEAESFTTEYGAGSSEFVWKGKDPALATDFPTTAVAYDYGKTVGWQITQGRDFSKDFAMDTAAFIVNEAAVRFMGLKHPIGERMTWFGRPLTIIGVVKDIIVESPYAPVRPFFFYIYDYARGNVILRLNPAVSAHDALATIGTVFKKYNPSEPFDYQFADSQYARKFGQEERIGKLASFFAILAIFISCLGLFGMASFMAEQRKKEIGVRKVLGASVANLWGLLSRDFVVLVSISFVTAMPVAYFLMSKWLENYQYRTAITWWIFALTGAGAMAITLFTVSFQTIRAALMNPVRSLRTE